DRVGALVLRHERGRVDAVALADVLRHDDLALEFGRDGAPDPPARGRDDRDDEDRDHGATHDLAPPDARVDLLGLRAHGFAALVAHVVRQIIVRHGAAPSFASAGCGRQPADHSEARWESPARRRIRPSLTRSREKPLSRAILFGHPTMGARRAEAPRSFTTDRPARTC